MPQNVLSSDTVHMGHHVLEICILAAFPHVYRYVLYIHAFSLSLSMSPNFRLGRSGIGGSVLRS